MPEDRRTDAERTPLDRAIDQVLREMASGEPPEGLSSTVRRRIARLTEGAQGSVEATAREPGRRWLVPAAAAATIVLAAVVYWAARPNGPATDPTGVPALGTIADAGRAAARGGADPIAGAVGGLGRAGAPALPAEAGVPASMPGDSAAGRAGGGVIPIRTADRRADPTLTAEWTGTDEWAEADRWAGAAEPGLAAGAVGAAVALGELGEEEEFSDPRFPRLVVRPLAPPAPPSFVPVQVHDVTIAEITIAPIEVRPLDPDPKPQTEKIPNQEERR